MTLSAEENVQRGPACKTQLPDGLARYIYDKLGQYGDKVALEYPELDGLQLTYADLALQSAQASSALKDLGLQPGDVLALASAGGPRFTPLMVGALLRGVVIAPFNPDFDPDETQHVLGFLRPRALIADKPKELYYQSVPTVITGEEVEGWFRKHVDGVSGVEAEEVPLEKPAAILCSSGTTGYPKGIEVSHKALLYLLAIATDQGMMQLGEGSFLLISPIFWISATAMLLLSIQAGSRTVIMSEFKEPQIYEILPKYKVVATLMSPYLGVKLCKMNPAPDLTPLRIIAFGGSVMDRETQAELQRKFRLIAQQAYGMTELLVALCSEARNPPPLGSVGRPHPTMEVKVVDLESGVALGPGKEGELCFRGPTVTTGYYNDPKATAAAIDAEGWFHTGDVGYYDEAGYFYITDRLNDFIKYKAQQVPSALMEKTLLSHPDVLDAAVVGVPDPLCVELPRAYVTLQPGSQVSAEELLEFANNDVSDRRKLRGGIVFIDKLPRTATGKVCKRILREMARK